MNKENADFIKEKIKDEIILPEALSQESIEKLLTENKPKKKKNAVIRRFVAVSVAACVMLTSVILLKDKISFSPEVIPENNSSSPTEKPTIQTPEKISAYSDLVSYIRAYAEETKDDYIYLYVDGEMNIIYDDVAMEGEVAADESAPAPTSPAGGAINKDDHGETNTREEGVAEEDVFITDGKYLYYIDADSDIRIVEANKDGTLTEISSIKSEAVYSNENGKYFRYTGLYRYENYLLASYSCQYINENKKDIQASGIYVFDISDISAPEKVREITLDGYYFSSRIIGSKLILVCNYNIRRFYTDETDVRLLPGFYCENERQTVPVESIVCLQDEAPESYINIAIADLNDSEKEIEISSFLGYAGEIYCTEDTLYSLKREYGYSTAIDTDDGFIVEEGESKTKITAIDISGDAPQFKASTKVEGSLLNSFSIDEHNGYLRLALTKNNENCITVLDSQLEKTGELSGIAPGERIQSARFMGDTAYVVTFVQTDPLFVIDMKDPTAPKILGEVKLPGFSAYLHPATEGYLVGIGYGGTEDGLDGSAKISLFDVKDPSSPKETDALVFENTDLITEYKAYCSVSESSFIVPFIQWDYEGKYNYYLNVTGAFSVSAENGELTLDNTYEVLCTTNAIRVTYIGDYIYLCSQYAGIASFDRESGEFISTVGALKEDYTFSSIDSFSQ